MKKLLFAIVLSSCGVKDEIIIYKGDNGDKGDIGKSCTVQEMPTGAFISCEDGTSASIFNGLDGQSIVGAQGPAGQDGVSCSVQDVLTGALAPNGGALITCGLSSTLVVNGAPGANGAAGQDGQDAAPSAYSIVEVIDPCGNAAGVYDEVILKMANGTLIASFSENNNGKNTRLSVLPQGNYQTTDGTSCNFSVSNTNNVTW